MRRAAIVSPVRTPVGSFGGSLRSIPVERLGSIVVNAVLERTEIDPDRIEDVVFAQSYANSDFPASVAGSLLRLICHFACQACSSTAAVVGGFKPSSRPR